MHRQLTVEPVHGVRPSSGDKECSTRIEYAGPHHIPGAATGGHVLDRSQIVRRLDLPVLSASKGHDDHVVVVPVGAKPRSAPDAHVTVGLGVSQQCCSNIVHELSDDRSKATVSVVEV